MGPKILNTTVLGRVEWFKSKDGYGFIKRIDTGESIFVHHTAIVTNDKRQLWKLEDGQKVQFDIVAGKKGPQAANVTQPGGVPIESKPYEVKSKEDSKTINEQTTAAPVVPKILKTKVLGKVKWFKEKEGYGFIEMRDQAESIFFHYTAIVRKDDKQHFCKVEEGQKVQFDIVEGKKGRRAANITGQGGVLIQGKPYEVKSKEDSKTSNEQTTAAPVVPKILKTKVLGKVKLFKEKEGYGFIEMRDQAESIFFHYTDIVRKDDKQHFCKVEEGQKVQFDIVEGKKGRRAANITCQGGVLIQGKPYEVKTKENRVTGNGCKEEVTKECLPTQPLKSKTELTKVSPATVATKDLSQNHLDEILQVTEERDRLKLEIEALKCTMEKELAAKKAEVDKDLQTKEEEYQKNLEAHKTKSTKEVKEKQKHLQEKLEAQKKILDKERAALKAQFDEELKAQQENYQKQLEAHKYRKEVKEKQERLQEELEAQKKYMENELAAVKAQFDKDLLEKQENYREQLEAHKTEYRKELKREEARLQEELVAQESRFKKELESKTDKSWMYIFSGVCLVAGFLSAKFLTN